MTITAATGGGTTATATSVIDGTGKVTGITITDPGYYPNQIAPTASLAATDTNSDIVGSITAASGTYTYTAAPTVTITAASGGGRTATATAAISGTNGSGAITIPITDPGYYPRQAAPTATLSAATTGTAPNLTVVMAAPDTRISPGLTVVMANALEVLTANYASPSGLTYFFVTATVSSVGSYSPNKSVLATIKSPTSVSTEFQAAIPFYNLLVNHPGLANILAPLAYRYCYGVTPWNTKGNQATITNILSAYGNIILTGAEGGISNACLFKGMLMDGTQASWWYGIDWIQIQVKQALAAAIINGSNSNPPLLYDQAGINTLQKVAQQVCDSAVSFGCALSAVVTATDFPTYVTQNPNDYQAGIYNGLECTAVGQNGFLTITFNLDAVQFAS